MKHNEIIRALECCKTGYCYQYDCPLVNGFDDDISKCTYELAKNALSLIKELTEKNEKLTKRCALRQKDLDDTLDLLYKAEEENERLIEAGFDTVDYAIDKIKQARVDAIKEMQARVKEAICDYTYPDFNKDGKPVNVWKAHRGYDLIDDIAEVMCNEIV